jgi:hypothetical protein
MLVHSVIETKAFLAAAKDAGMDEEEREALVTTIANNPRIGDVMQGTGGCRKRRYRKRGTGKSGGYRIISWFGGDDIPVVLLSVFGKNERANLSKAERNDVAKLTGQLRDSLRKKK